MSVIRVPVVALKNGRPLGQTPTMVLVSFRMDERMMFAFDGLANELEQPRSALLRAACVEYLKSAKVEWE